MVYSTTPDARVPGLATIEAAAKGFVERLVMHTVFAVLESQSRSALLPHAVTSAILSQLTVRVTYTPLMCTKVHLGLTDMTTMLTTMDRGCIIVDNTVTGICTYMMAGQMKECTTVDPMIKITPVSGPPLKIFETLSTTNIVMANWSRTMWQGVLDRAVRMLASDSFGSHFFSASTTVGGN
ncbi:hypothetical protein KIN20_012486 [Parelaphostrongylus tenuis]|uniref:Uncharacterized protein n=1 Tax=Parelaphostrongylus tenuis TaxID=148309 RepID=A0AAD5MTE6_PARTN|nr:hypothetical protein KIN20_012486 [Parelaphostrongylus tenuis]